MALLASASHLEARSQCNTGAISCCNSVQTVNQASTLLGAFGLVGAATSVGGLVGLTCTPVTVIGTGSGCSAQQQAVCCSNNEYQGLVNFGCSPINVNA
ncbi:hydrophobin [Imleria badia]|nr:hydrophobin [Imleria badia]